MKFVLCFLIVAAVAVATISADAGQSACRDQSEIGQTFPHHFDHSKYWYCEKFGEAAIEMDCPQGKGYMHILRECIPWENWVWKKPENPPTLA